MELALGRDREIEAHLKALGWIDGDEQLVALAPAGEGNMNRTLRVSLARIGSRQPGRSVILKQAVPYVARYPHIPAPVERLEVERAFYGIVSRSAALAVRVPGVLGADMSNHLLCLEDLGEAADFTSLYQTAGDAAQRGAVRGGQLTALVYWLWKLHALDLGSDTPGCLENRAMRRLNHAHIFEIPFANDNGVALSPVLSSLQAEFATDAALRQQAAALGRIYLGEQHHESTAALLHGDYYPGSWLHHPSRGVMVIDPEFAFVGPPEFDVGVLFAHLLMAGYPQGDIMGLLQSYVRPAGFNPALAMGFAGMEVIRRLLGVAQLPLAATDDVRTQWLQAARQMVAP
ncbi:MAG: phosphotransferase [Pseudomonadales bacterium]